MNIKKTYLYGLVFFTVIFSLSPHVFSQYFDRVTSYSWSIGKADSYNKGWALINNNEKIFAIGLWGIPYYTFTKKGAEPKNNGTLFTSETDDFNLIHIQRDFQKPYMQSTGKIVSTGLTTFRWYLSESGYTGNIDLYTDDEPSNDSILNYERMKSIREKTDSLEIYIETEIVDSLIADFDGYNFIHFIMDEPDTGGRGWYWHPDLLKIYNDYVHEQNTNNLTYLDLGGNICGNRFFYEKTFGDTFKVGINPNNGECSPDNMDTYNYASDSTSVYAYRRRWIFKDIWARRPNSYFIHKFYDNVKETASAYKNASDVLGVNSYSVFRDYPEVAGETVDAIKAGCGSDKPVWLFFDAAADQKPRSMSYADYFKNIKCQVYTSIVHGATGAFFYAITDSEPVKTHYWPKIKSLAKDLQEKQYIFVMPVVDQYWNTKYHLKDYEHLHYSIRSSGKEKNVYLIATNTNKNKSLEVAIKGFPEFTLEPLGFKIIEKDGAD